MPISTVLFDLDGTLIDSGAGIRRCADLSLQHHGLPPLTDEQFGAFIGPPLATSFGSLTPDPSLTEPLVVTYREHYAAGGMYEYTVYDGVPEMIDEMIDRGFTIAVATSKVTPFAREVLIHAGLSDGFELILGAEFDGTRGTKTLVMADVLSSLAIDDPTSVVMVGDREHDAHGASDLGTGFIGVAWGFGRPGELEAAGATEIVTHPAELAHRVTGMA